MQVGQHVRSFDGIRPGLRQAGAYKQITRYRCRKRVRMTLDVITAFAGIGYQLGPPRLGTMCCHRIAERPSRLRLAAPRDIVNRGCDNGPTKEREKDAGDITIYLM